MKFLTSLLILIWKPKRILLIEDDEFLTDVLLKSLVIASPFAGKT